MLKNYIKIALRNLGLNRTYATLNILGLGMGMAGAIMIFFFLQYHLSTDRHQPHFDRVYRVVLNLLLDEGTEHSTDSSVPMAAALARDYAHVEKVGFIRKNPNTTLSSISAKGVNRFIEKDNVVFVNQDFMQMFSFEWLGKGAALTMKEPNTVVLTEKMAQKYFGTKDAIGKTLTYANSTDLRIAGIIKDQILPSDLNFEIYISLPTLKKVEPGYEMDNFGWLSARNAAFIRVAKGAKALSIEKLLVKNGPKYYGETAKYYEHKLQALSDVHFDERYDGKIRPSILWILAGVGAFLLAIACINFINLATAHALKRSKEIGIRKALGSTQRQLFLQFMCETALLTIGSAFFSLILLVLLLPFFNNWTPAHAFHFSMLFRPRSIVFWSLIMTCVTVLAGFYPSLIISGFDPIRALKSNPGIRQAGRFSLRHSLIIVQLIIAQVMVIATVVLILQLRYFKNADLGFDKNAVITISIPKINPDQNSRESLRNNLLQYPAVNAVTYQYEAPTSSMGYGGSLRFDNRVEWEKFIIRNRFGDSHYLPTYKMPLLAGRNITSKDSVVEFVVNEELMHKLGIRDPQKMLGRQLEDGNSGLKGEVVGVVKSFHLKSLQEAVEPCVIFANPKLYKELAVRLNTNDFQNTIHTIQQVWQKKYPDEVFSYQFLEEQIAKFYEREEQLTTLIRAFAIVAILICCLGLYGMVSFIVTQRTREIGVRKVLGAGAQSIILLFGKEFVVLVSLAFIIAAPIAWCTMTHWLNNFAYHIDLTWRILASGGALVLLTTLVVVGHRVVKAAFMNPVNSLKTE
jgi:putative ABC transport system permease protein